MTRCTRFIWPDDSLRDRHPEAFNGDGFALEEVERLVNRFKIKTIVETGTHTGETTSALADLAKHVHTIELNSEYLGQARSRLRGVKNVTCWKGSSPEILRQLVPTLNGPVLFYLDAHWNKYNPLLDELATISDCEAPPVLMRHDFKVPGTDLGYDTYDGQEYCWEWVSDRISPVYRELGFHRYYNTVAEGARRGILFVVPQDGSA